MTAASTTRSLPSRARIRYAWDMKNGAWRPAAPSGLFSMVAACGLAVACGGPKASGPASDPPPPASASSPPVSASASSPAPGLAAPVDVCKASMRRTRECADVFVPGLMALRVRLDRPKGIAARFQTEGQEKMLATAREQFAGDWSDAAIEKNCAELAQKPADDQERIVAPDRRCLSTTRDCRGFTDCDLANKEARWTKSP